MSMNFFAFFPALANPATNPHANGTGFFANPAGPTGEQLRRARRPGHLDRVLLEEAGRVDEVPGVVHQGRRPRRSGPSSAATPAAPAVLKSDEFRKATPYNEAFYQSMFMVKDFWATPEYAELLDAAQPALYPFVVGGKGTAKEALDGLAKRLGRDLQEVQAATSKRTPMRGRGQASGFPPARRNLREDEASWRRSQSTEASTRGSRAARARHERPRDPQPVHHPDDPVPDRLQHLPADLFARLFVHRLPRVGQRARRASSACRTIATC